MIFLKQYYLGIKTNKTPPQSLRLLKHQFDGGFLIVGWILVFPQDALDQRTRFARILALQALPNTDIQGTLLAHTDRILFAKVFSIWLKA